MQPRYLICFLAAAASTAGAQVGHAPQSSPYRDVEIKHSITYFAGYYGGATDPARVAPMDGPMVGARYSIRLGGPVFFTGRLAGVFSERSVVDPTLPPAQRRTGTTSVPLLFGDAGFDLALTGAKSWHSFVPALNASIGLAADLSGKRDKSQFSVGLPFLLSFGPSLRFVPGGGKWSYRLDVTDHYFRIRYPESFFLKTGPDSTFLPADGKRTVWRHNWATTLGASIALFR
ncbi:MAG: hypothetical protein ACT4R6_06445 [Gemmatimonadaceae bacterium]